MDRNIKKLYEIRYVENDEGISYLQFEYLTQSGKLVEGLPMGNIADGVTPTRYRMEDEADKFMTVYTGFKFNHLVFLKMTTLENSNVCSMGKDSYD